MEEAKTNTIIRATANQVAFLLQIEEAEGGVSISVAPAEKSATFDNEPSSTREAQLIFSVGEIEDTGKMVGKVRQLSRPGSSTHTRYF